MSGMPAVIRNAYAVKIANQVLINQNGNILYEGH